MRRLRNGLIAALSLVAVVALGNFITSNSSLPSTKRDLTPLPPGADPTRYIQASDYNALMNAINDTRTNFINGTFLGFAAQASHPTPPVGGSAFNIWVSSANSHPYFTANGVDTDMLGSSGTAVFFLTASWMKGLAPLVTTGDYSEGALFWVDQALHVVGASWFQPAGVTLTVTMKLWDVTAGGAAVATKSITPTANAINAAAFTSPYSITGSAVGHQFSITVRDGTNQLLYTGGIPAPLTFNPGQWGPHLFLYSYGFASGDAGALQTSSNYTGLDLNYTVP